jgi:hypothetical protein
MKPKHVKLINRALEHPEVDAVAFKTLCICLKLEGQRVGRYMLHEEYHRGVNNPFEKSPTEITLWRKTKKLERLGFLNRYVVSRKYTVYTGRYETAKSPEVSPKVKQLKHAQNYRKHSLFEKSLPKVATANESVVSQKVNISKESNLKNTSKSNPALVLPSVEHKSGPSLVASQHKEGIYLSSQAQKGICVGLPSQAQEAAPVLCFQKGERKSMNRQERMYHDTKTWNPFKGCKFDCIYCEPTFQRQAKRQKQNCIACYHYRPHYHEERLSRIPSANIVFVCGNGDISFCKPDFTRKIIHSIKAHNERAPHKQYYFQSKRPEYLNQFLADFPSNVILVTTLESNRDGYENVSKAPRPSERYQQFKALGWPQKVVTVEPIMDFDLAEFHQMLVGLNPLYVWLGFNSRPKEVQLPEPSKEKVNELIARLASDGIEIREKDLRHERSDTTTLQVV